MAISIDWGQKIISVPQADLTFVSGFLYRLNVNDLRNALKLLEESEDGITFPPTLRHNTQVTLGGLTLARVVEIINGYTITFTPNSQWAVELTGGNNNIADVLNVNQVQLRSANTAGMVVGLGAVTQEDKNYIVDMVDLVILDRLVLAGITQVGGITRIAGTNLVLDGVGGKKIGAVA